GVAVPHSGQTPCTLEACTGASRSTSPPLIWRPGFGFVWRLIMFRPSTITRFVEGRTFSTRPRLPRSLPVVTTTLSFRRTGVCRRDISENLRSQRNDLHEPALAQLAGHRPEHARADRLVLVVDQDRRGAVQAAVAAVPAGRLLNRAPDHAPPPPPLPAASLQPPFPPPHPS